jgi:hypothetical protein
MKNLLSILFFVLFTTIVSAQVSKTINVASPGTLSSLLTATEKATVTNLTVTGNIDARDIKFIHLEMTVLAVIDLSEVKIIAYSGTEGTDNSSYDIISYPANEMPKSSFSAFAFSVNKSLYSIILPSSITSIGQSVLFKLSRITGTFTIPSSVNSIKDYAFNHCFGLKNIIILNPLPPTRGYGVFINSDTDSNLAIDNVYVPIGSLSAYKASGWSTFNIVEYKLKVSSLSASSITSSSMVLNGKLDFIAATPVSAYGFCWNATGSPSITDNKVDNGAKTSLGAYNNTISD